MLSIINVRGQTHFYIFVCESHDKNVVVPVDKVSSNVSSVCKSHSFTNFIEGICSNDTSYDLTDPPTALSKAEILNNQVFFDLPFLHLISLSLSKQLYIACHYMFDNIFIKNHYSHSVSTRRWSPNVTVTNHTLLLDWNSWGAFDVCSVHYYIPFYFRKLLHTKYTLY